MVGQGTGFGARHTWVLVCILLLPSWMVLGKSLNLLKGLILRSSYEALCPGPPALEGTAAALFQHALAQGGEESMPMIKAHVVVHMNGAPPDLCSAHPVQLQGVSC